MFKYVLSPTFAVSFATAATISTSATCDGLTISGTTNAFCNDGFFMASANLEAPSIVTNPGPGTFSVFVSAGPVAGPPPLSSGSASARFSGEYLFTVTGGIGNGFFFPCFNRGFDTGATSEISFAGVGLEGLNCASSVFASSIPFSFGVPQIVGIGMGGDAEVDTHHFNEESDASASLEVILFFDSSGNVLTNVTYTLASVDLPEPSAVSLLIVGLMFCTTLALALSKRTA